MIGKRLGIIKTPVRQVLKAYLLLDEGIKYYHYLSMGCIVTGILVANYVIRKDKKMQADAC